MVTENWYKSLFYSAKGNERRFVTYLKKWSGKVEEDGT